MQRIKKILTLSGMTKIMQIYEGGTGKWGTQMKWK